MPSLNPLRIAITCEYPALLEQAKTLAGKMQLPMASKSGQYDFQLILTTEHLQLQDMRENAPGPVFVDFITGKNAHRRLYGGGRNQPLARAVGIKKDYLPTIIDATAGLGRDSFVLATLGCDVTLIERSPIISALLENGLARASLNTEIHSILSRMHLIQADAITYLRSLTTNLPDTIYLDPMYPHRSKSALVKKEMRIAREIVGDDSDAASLLNTALQYARKRVVVKRPLAASKLSEINPTLVIKSKNTRYDIYFPSVI